MAKKPRFQAPEMLPIDNFMAQQQPNNPTAPTRDNAKDLPPQETPKMDSKANFNDSPRIIYDQEKGVASGIVLPNGKQYLGISPNEVKYLARKYAAVPGTIDNNTPVAPQTPTPAPNVSDEQLSKVESSLTAPVAPIPTDPISQEIARLNARGNKIDNSVFQYAPINKLSAPLNKILRKTIGVSTSDVLGALPEGKFTQATKDYFDDYSTQDSADTINTRISDARQGIEYSLSLSRDKATANESMDLFESSVRSIRVGQMQLKQANARGSLSRDTVNDMASMDKYLKETVPNKYLELQQNLLNAK